VSLLHSLQGDSFKELLSRVPFGTILAIIAVLILFGALYFVLQLIIESISIFDERAHIYDFLIALNEESNDATDLRAYLIGKSKKKDEKEQKSEIKAEEFAEIEQE